MFSVISQLIFGSSGLFGSHGDQSGIRSSSWKDKSLCFDLRSQDLELDGGEQLIGCFFPIEDVKGNQDELGLMKVTNLRLIWICCKKKRVNLSIGWRTVSLAYEHCLKDALGGSSTSLFVLTKYESTKYEIVFNRHQAQNDVWNGGQENWNIMSQLRKFSQEKGSQISHLSPMYLDDPFEVVFKVWQAYRQTHLFRHCRSNLTHLLLTDPSQGLSVDTRDVHKLPSEEILETFANICQFESKAVKYVGTLMLTNIRIIWLDDSVPLRNLSIPYIRIENIKLKQADRIVINTYDYLASSTHAEFRLQKASNGAPAKTIKVIHDQLQNFYSLYRSKPRYGPESSEDCVNIMSHLRPIEHYFESIDESIVKALENFGPEPNRDTNQSRTTNPDEIRAADGVDLKKIVGDNDVCDDEEGAAGDENELNKYSSNLSRYMNEKPLEHDNELIYSESLGLVIERPTKDDNIDLLWKIEL